MKLMMFAALAAAVATPALAQTAPATTPDTTMSQPSTTPTTPAPSTTPMANDSAATPAAAPMPATGSYPMCSRTVTDQCTERSNTRGERMHSTPRKHKR